MDEGRPARVERPQQVDADDGLEPICAQLSGLRDEVARRRVHEHIETPERGDHAPDGLLDVSVLAHVRGSREGRPARRLDLAHDRVEHLAPPAENAHLGTLLR